jgi:hypothetical protein
MNKPHFLYTPLHTVSQLGDTPTSGSLRSIKYTVGSVSTITLLSNTSI